MSPQRRIEAWESQWVQGGLQRQGNATARNAAARGASRSVALGSADRKSEQPLGLRAPPVPASVLSSHPLQPGTGPWDWQEASGQELLASVGQKKQYTLSAAKWHSPARNLEWNQQLQQLRGRRQQRQQEPNIQNGGSLGLTTATTGGGILRRKGVFNQVHTLLQNLRSLSSSPSRFRVLWLQLLVPSFSSYSRTQTSPRTICLGGGDCPLQSDAKRSKNRGCHWWRETLLPSHLCEESELERSGWPGNRETLVPLGGAWVTRKRPSHLKRAGLAR